MRTFAAYLLLGGTFLLPVLAGHPAGSSVRFARAGAPLPDTLRDTVAAGEVYVRTLPSERSGESVETYEPVRPPALSWIVDRSLVWNTEGHRPGRHRLTVLARTASAVDTLVLDLTLTTP